MVDRRTALKAIGGVPLAAMGSSATLAATDNSEVSISTWMQESVGGYLARPSSEPAPAVLLIHEWWGLNDQIKKTAVRFADEGFLALAVDLYQGQVAQEPEDARSLMQAVTPDEALETLTAWVDWLRGPSEPSILRGRPRMMPPTCLSAIISCNRAASMPNFLRFTVSNGLATD